ncbi:DUF2306 domain-containing protein [Kineococcus arenarius]|uniref:DUF2306 domain-containing protein n=1 Tax=Kineococcus sp. SYSU DK007 TaxID=3383128 RepID=UPI003D7E9F07
MTGWTPLLAAHAASALICLGLGAHVLLRRTKGDGAHRAAGWCWVTGMTFVATSSFAIRDLRDGRLSLLHVLSVVTLVSLVLGIRAARRHDVRAHRANMRGSWFGLVGAFLGAVAVPDRAVPTFVVTEPLGALAAAGATAAATAGLIALARAGGRRRPGERAVAVSSGRR